MKNQYFLKDKKAQIYRRVYTKDQYANRIAAYYPYAAAPLWCYSKQLSQALTFLASTYNTDETRLFVFSYHSGIKPYDYILYRGEWYEVTRVDTTDDYNTDLFIYVKDVADASTPDDDAIQEYDATAWE